MPLLHRLALAYPYSWRLRNAPNSGPALRQRAFFMPGFRLEFVCKPAPIVGNGRDALPARARAALFGSFSDPPVSRRHCRVSSSLIGVEIMPRLSTDTLKAAIDPESYYRTALTWKGKPNVKGWILAVCPFHADSAPSLAVNLHNGGFHCFGCGEKGDLISFHAKLNSFPFRKAVNDLAQRYLLNLGD